MTCAHPPARLRTAFSLVEIVIVVVIIGIVAAIAVPRMSSAASRARATSIRADLAAMNRAAEFYTAEHGGLHPGQDKTGAPLPDGTALVLRLTEQTDVHGEPGTIYGPYLLRMPVNPFNGLTTVRIDGAPAGAGTHGWRYDSPSRAFQADDSVQTASITADSLAATVLEKDGAGGVKVLGGAAVMALEEEK